MGGTIHLREALVPDVDSQCVELCTPLSEPTKAPMSSRIPEAPEGRLALDVRNALHAEEALDRSSEDLVCVDLWLISTFNAQGNSERISWTLRVAVDLSSGRPHPRTRGRSRPTILGLDEAAYGRGRPQ